MITIRKLKTLKTGTLRRKTAVILQSFENSLLQGDEIDRIYLSALLEIITEVFSDAENVQLKSGVLSGYVNDLEPDLLIREINGLRHAVLKVLGTEPADWDLSISHSPVSGYNISDSDEGVHRRLELYLDDLRSPFNIGSVFRTAEAFGVSRIMLSPDCPSPDHPRARRSSMGCTDLVSWEWVSKDDVFGTGCAGRECVFALELGGAPISDFMFPGSGIAVIGSEELGISPEARKAASEGCGLVSIPVAGLKGSINVSVAFGIMMQRWSESVHF